MRRDIETTTLPQTPLDYATVDTNNLDFNPHDVVGQLPAHPRREFLRRFVAGTALFVGVGMATFTVADVMTGEDTSSQAQDVAAAEATIQTAQETAVEADLNLDRKTAELGEACTTLFYDYMPNVTIEYDEYNRPSVDVVGGQLRDVAEDSMVTDVITAPNAPCGEGRTEVRSGFRDLVAVYSDKIIKQHDVTEAREELAQQNQETSGIQADADDQQWPNGALAGLVPGMLVGAAMGIRPYRRAMQTNAQFTYDQLVPYIRNRLPLPHHNDFPEDHRDHSYRRSFYSPYQRALEDVKRDRRQLLDRIMIKQFGQYSADDYTRMIS